MATTQKSEKRRAIATAAFTGIVTAAILAVTSYAVVWIRLRDNFTGSWTHRHEGVNLHLLTKFIEDYRTKHGAYPDNFTQVTGHPQETDGLLDTWGRMYGYRVTAEGYELSSLGRDGRPGGEGLDADFYYDPQNWRSVQPKNPPARISLFQFHEVNPGSARLCTFYSIAIGVGVFFSGLPSKRGIQPRKKLLLSAAITTVFSLIVAGYMSGLHIPNGH